MHNVIILHDFYFIVHWIISSWYDEKAPLSAFFNMKRGFGVVRISWTDFFFIFGSIEQPLIKMLLQFFLECNFRFQSSIFCHTCLSLWNLTFFDEKKKIKFHRVVILIAMHFYLICANNIINSIARLSESDRKRWRAWVSESVTVSLKMNEWVCISDTFST